MIKNRKNIGNANNQTDISFSLTKMRIHKISSFSQKRKHQSPSTAILILKIHCCLRTWSLAKDNASMPKCCRHSRQTV